MGRGCAAPAQPPNDVVVFFSPDTLAGGAQAAKDRA